MKPELKAKWVEALRSAMFAQTKEALSDDSGYCCLGVLLCVSDMGTWDDHNLFFLDDYSGELEGDLGRYGPNVFGVPTDIEKRLIEMNDNEGKSFAEIADYIESVL